MRNDYVLICLLLLAAFTYHQWKGQQEKFYPGAVAPATPVQKSNSSLRQFTREDFTIHPFAEFEVHALVLSAHHYFWGQEAKLVPVDLALGWGPMSDGDVLKDISISQGNRWYFFSYQKQPLIARDEIISHSGNMHLIPSTLEIEKMIKDVHKGDVVEFKGQLVDITKADGWHWNSSRSRTDTGAGSCEVVLVNDFQIVDRKK